MNLAVHFHSRLAPPEVSAYYRVRMPDLEQLGSEWRAGCPIHKGEDSNFSANAETGLWMCHSQCGRGGPVYDLEIALTGADFPDAAPAVRRIIGRPDSRPAAVEPQMKWGLLGWQHEYLRKRIEKVEAGHGWKHSAAYPCFEADGRFSDVKVRFIDKQNDKTFRQYALSSSGGWISRRKAGKQPILYRLNTPAAADEIFIVNGEKAAGRGAAELRIVTACAPGGEGKWCAEYTKPRASWPGLWRARNSGGNMVSASRPRSWLPTAAGARRTTSLAGSSRSAACLPSPSTARPANSTNAIARGRRARARTPSPRLYSAGG